MNLKPFRDYSEHDVLNLFSFVHASGDKGTVVALSTSATYKGTAAVWNTSVNLSPSAGPVSFRPVVPNKVEPATTTSTSDAVLGLLIYDVREFDENGEKLIFQPAYKKQEMCVVTSGEAVPVLTKGLVEIAGFSGVAAPGYGAFVGLDGQVVAHVTGLPAFGPKIGKFLTNSGADGYALLKVGL